jgi:ABC-type uncharacterized transport system permease subunit
MNNRWLLQFRLTFSMAATVFFLAESLNAQFLRQTAQSQTLFVHFSIAIFGAAWLVQSFALIGQLRDADSK